MINVLICVNLINMFIINDYDYDFVSQIGSFDLEPSHVLVSYDVVALFFNIPLNETIDIASNYVCQQHSPPIYYKET